MMNALEVASTFRMDVGVMKGGAEHGVRPYLWRAEPKLT